MKRLFLVAAWLVALTAHAGDRKLYMQFINMTPDAASSPASRDCVRAMIAPITADYVQFTKSGETPLRKLVGKTNGEPFVEWTAETLAPVRKKLGAEVDAIVLVDCRPESGHATALVSPPVGGMIRLSIDSPPANWAKAAATFGGAILRRAWLGFSP